jgi:HSP20 family protein
MTLRWLNRLKQATHKAGQALSGRGVTILQGRAPRQAEAPTEPVPVDVFENDSELVIVADVPGASPADTEVYLDKAVVGFRARAGNGEKGVSWMREFRLPEMHGLDETHARSSLNQGVLTIHIPKRRQRSIRVPVKVVS